MSRISSPVAQTLKSLRDEEIITDVSRFIRNQDAIASQPRRRPSSGRTPGNTSRWTQDRNPIIHIESMSSVNLNSPAVGSSIEQLMVQDVPKVSGIKEKILKTHFSDFRSSSRSVFAIVCIIYAFYQMGVTTMTYFEYKTGVAVKEEDIISLSASLPGITVCNKNLIEKSSAFRYMPGFSEAIRFQLGEDPEMDGKSDYEKELKIKSNPAKFKALIEVYEDFMSTYYAEMSVSRQLKDGPDMERFLKYLECNQKGWPEWDEKKRELVPSKFNCQKKGWINTAQGKGNCITLFHQVRK